MAFLSGWGGGIQIGSVGIFLPVLRWQVEINTDLAEITAGPSVNKSYVVGYTDVGANFECLWNTNQDVLTPPASPRLRPGDGVILRLRLDSRGNKVFRSWYMPNFLITTFTMDSEVRGVVKYQVQGKQSGDSYLLYPANNQAYDSAASNLDQE